MCITRIPCLSSFAIKHNIIFSFNYLPAHFLLVFHEPAHQNASIHQHKLGNYSLTNFSTKLRTPIFSHNFLHLPFYSSVLNRSVSFCSFFYFLLTAECPLYHQPFITFPASGKVENSIYCLCQVVGNVGRMVCGGVVEKPMTVMIAIKN